MQTKTINSLHLIQICTNVVNVIWACKVEPLSVWFIILLFVFVWWQIKTWLSFFNLETFIINPSECQRTSRKLLFLFSNSFLNEMNAGNLIDTIYNLHSQFAHETPMFTCACLIVIRAHNVYTAMRDLYICNTFVSYDCTMHM